MFTTTILLDTIDKVKDFVATTSKFDADFDVRFGRYVVDGKSIMGILALDTSKPHEVLVNCAGTDQYIEGIRAALGKFECK